MNTDETTPKKRGRPRKVVDEDVEPEDNVDVFKAIPDEEPIIALTDKGRPLSWVTFLTPVRVSSQSNAVPAATASPTRTLTREEWDGLPILVIRDNSIPRPVNVPWHAVGSFEFASDG